MQTARVGCHNISDHASLLNGLYGLYSIKMYGISQFFAVMQNVIRAPEDIQIHERFPNWLQKAHCLHSARAQFL